MNRKDVEEKMEATRTFIAQMKQWEPVHQYTALSFIFSALVSEDMPMEALLEGLEAAHQHTDPLAPRRLQ